MLFKCDNCGKRYWKPSSRRACWTGDTMAMLFEGRDIVPSLTLREEHIGKPISHVHLTETGSTDAAAALLQPPRVINMTPPRKLPNRSLGEREARWWVGGRSHASDVDFAGTDFTATALEHVRRCDVSDSRDSDSCSSSGDSSGGGD